MKMKLSATQQAIADRSNRIAVLQDEIKVIQRAEDLINGGAAPRRAPLIKAHQRFSTGRGHAGHAGTIKAPAAVSPAPAGAVATPLDKPDTVVGAIKYLLRDEPVGATFTRELLKSNLLEDADFKKLVAADEERAEKSIENALRNWTFERRLKKDGGNYTVTAELKAWLL